MPWIITIGLWVILFVCIVIMRKLDPTSYKIYAVYGFFVCLAFTALAVMDAV